MIKHPQSEEHVMTGLRRAGGWLLGMAWLGLVYAGIIEAFGSQRDFGEGSHPSPILGYTLLVVAAVVMVATAEHWKRVFPGIMLAAILNAVLELRASLALDGGNSFVCGHHSHIANPNIQKSQTNHAGPRCVLSVCHIIFLGSHRRTFCFAQAACRRFMHSNGLGC